MECWSIGVVEYCDKRAQHSTTPLLQILTLQFVVSLRHIAHQEQVIDIIHSAQLYAKIVASSSNLDSEFARWSF
jgi:hypothetical protein